MIPVINTDKFIQIFERKHLRTKLDKLILNFYGLENNKQIENSRISKAKITLTFHVYINEKLIFKIQIVDTRKLFDSSKNFYIHFTYENIEKNYNLVMPCYWEFYCLYCRNNYTKHKPITILAAMLACEKIEEVQQLLIQIKIFNEDDIEEILAILA